MAGFVVCFEIGEEAAADDGGLAVPSLCDDDLAVLAEVGACVPDGFIVQDAPGPSGFVVSVDSGDSDDEHEVRETQGPSVGPATGFQVVPDDSIRFGSELGFQLTQAPVQDDMGTSRGLEGQEGTGKG